MHLAFLSSYTQLSVSPPCYLRLTSPPVYYSSTYLSDGFHWTQKNLPKPNISSSSSQHLPSDSETLLPSALWSAASYVFPLNVQYRGQQQKANSSNRTRSESRNCSVRRQEKGEETPLGCNFCFWVNHLFCMYKSIAAPSFLLRVPPWSLWQASDV